MMLRLDIDHSRGEGSLGDSIAFYQMADDCPEAYGEAPSALTLLRALGCALRSIRRLVA